MPTPSEIVQGMRNALALTEPGLDTSIGTPVRKLLDAVGEAISESYADQYLLSYAYDIDAKSGTDLDDFAALFGFTRLPARRATGSVVFERTTASTEPILIDVGTQVATDTSPPVIVQTVVPATLPAGETAIAIPVQAVLGGAAGNVASNTIRRRVSALSGGISSFTNPAALTGGADAESDAALRERFKRTVFRNLAGTEQMFLGVALDDPDVSQANVMGASKRWREQLEVVGGTATSTVQNAKYIYPNSSIVGSNIDAGAILNPGVDYSFNDTVIPPTITSLNGTTMPDGIYDVEYEYVPNASRNDPDNGITNRIDVYVSGMRNEEASEIAVFHTASVFDTTVGSALNRANFQRLDGSQPVAGNFFVPLTFAPVTDPSVSDQITIGATTYVEGTDYWLVNDITAQGGTATSLSGIEFASTVAVPDATTFAVDYLYNAIPRDIEVALRAWRLVTTDARVHQALPVYLNMHFAAIVLPGYSLTGVQNDLYTRLAATVSSVGFARVVQVSDILAVAHSTPGIDAIRFLTSADDATTYAIQQVAADGTTLIATFDNGGTPARAVDVAMDDDSVPVLNAVTLVAKAQNSFGAV